MVLGYTCYTNDLILFRSVALSNHYLMPISTYIQKLNIKILSIFQGIEFKIMSTFFKTVGARYCDIVYVGLFFTPLFGSLSVLSQIYTPIYLIFLRIISLPYATVCYRVRGARMRGGVGWGHMHGAEAFTSLCKTIFWRAI